MGRLKAYINPFNVTGSAYSGWVEVTTDLLKSALGTIDQQLDVSDYDVGVFQTSSFSIELINTSGAYSDVGGGQSIFLFKRADSLFKITWDPAEFDYIAGFAQADDVVGNEFILFQGVLNDDSTVMQIRDQSISFDVLGYEALLDRSVIDSTWAGSLPATHKASDLLKRALAIAAAGTNAPVLTIDNTQIVPGNDVTWDDITVFTNKTVKEAVDVILTAANSVLYMNGTTPVVSGRSGALTASNPTFCGPASTLGPENILDIQDISSGLNRVFNFVTWTDSNNPPTVNLSSENGTSVAKYGARKKNVTVDGITTTATQQSVIDAIRTEFGTPEMELTLYTPMTPDTVALTLLSRVLIDYPLVTVDPNPAEYERAVYGVDSYPSVLSNFTIDTTTPFKILAISYDPGNDQIAFKLREIPT